MESKTFHPCLIIDRNLANQEQWESDCNCDCACNQSTDYFPLTAFDELMQNTRIIETEPFLNQFPLPGKEYYLCHSPNCSPILVDESILSILEFFKQPHSVLDALEEAQFGAEREEYLWAIKELFLHRMLRDIQETHENIQHENGTLSAWIHITDRCNLRCDYCYLPHMKKDMSLEVGIRAVDALIVTAKINGFSKLKIKFAGGEPTIKIRLVEEIAEYALKVTKANSIKLEMVLLTNGTLLTQSIISLIKSLGIKVMISLDGLGSYHEQHRSSFVINNSFQKTMEGIELCKKMGVLPYISITLTQENISGLPTLVDWLLKKRLYFGLNFYRENGNEKCTPVLNIDGSTRKAFQEVFAILSTDIPQYSLLTSLTDRANLAYGHLRPCGVGQDYLVIDTEGHVSKCQMDMPNTFTSVNDPNMIQSLRCNTKGFINPSVDEKLACRSCQWKYFCCGGCPLLAFRTSGSYRTKSPYCDIYQELFPQVMQLEGLRLLKHGMLLSPSNQKLL